MNEPAPPSYREPALAALCLVSALVVTLVAAEISLRVFLPMPALGREGDAPKEAPALRFEGSIFSRHVLPAAPLRVVTKRGPIYRINAKGYRGPDFDWEKPDDAVRIVVYGGSAVFDVNASEGEDWPALVERALAQRSRARVEVINAGTPGHASFDAVGRLLAEGHRLSPDYVVLYNAWNDIKYFGSDQPILRQFKPYLASRDPVRSPTGRLDGRLADLSHLYRFLRLRYHVWNRLLGTEGAKPAPEPSARSPKRAQLRQFQLNLRGFVDLARDIAAVPLLMTQGRLVSRRNTEAQRRDIAYEYVRLTHDGLVEAFEATDRIIHAVGREEDVAVIDASARLSGEARFFSDHVYLTRSGSAALAALVADALAPRIGAGARPSS